MCADDFDGHDWPILGSREVTGDEETYQDLLNKASDGSAVGTHVMPKLGQRTMSLFSTLASRSIHFCRPKSRPPGF